MALLSLSRVVKTFQSDSRRIFTRNELGQLIDQNLESWTIDRPPGSGDQKKSFSTKSPSQNDVLAALIEHTELRIEKLPFPYRAVARYTWHEMPTIVVIQSADAAGYFSHFSAIEVHGLTEQIPKAIYFNVEQPAQGGGGTLTQPGIDRAFKGRCRVSQNVIKFRGYTVHKLNGQNTGQLGVVEVSDDDGFSRRVTDLERTLIDATVRPVYSGGVGEVAKAFRNASDGLSLKKIVAYLNAMNFTYPYHQAIGFYLERAGFDDKALASLARLPIDFDFYLDYQLKNPAYNAKWRLFIPKGF